MSKQVTRILSYERVDVVARTVLVWLYGDVEASREGSSQRRGRRTHEAWASSGLAKLDLNVNRHAWSREQEELCPLKPVQYLTALGPFGL